VERMVRKFPWPVSLLGLPFVNASRCVALHGSRCERQLASHILKQATACQERFGNCLCFFRGLLTVAGGDCTAARPFLNHGADRRSLMKTNLLDLLHVLRGQSRPQGAGRGG
jgi:hypothetical protein